MWQAMKREYDAIYAAGFILQVDCPDLAMGRHTRFKDKVELVVIGEWYDCV